MNILLTGGTGYLGSHLLPRLVAEPEYRTVLLVRKSSQFGRIRACLPSVECLQVEDQRFEELIARREIDVIVHCATNYGRSDVPRPNTVEANLLLPLRLLDAAQRSKRRVTFVNTDTMLDKSISAYSRSKKQFREWLEVYSDELICANVELEHFFGPGDDPTKFVSFVVQALLRNAPSIPLTEGLQERDFVYIEDVVSAFLLILRFAARSSKGYYGFEIGRGAPVRIRNFVELAKKLCHNTVTRLDFGALPYRANEVMRASANTEKIRGLGWRPAFDVESGLRKMIEEERAWQQSI